MNQNENIPDWIYAARTKWNYTGKKRPPFAIMPNKNQISVWDFPRPPIIVKINTEVKVMKRDIVIAKSCNAVEIRETANPPTVYIPPHDVNTDLFGQHSNTSWCEWKGKATYWHLLSDEERIIAWSYKDPFVEYTDITNYIAFYPQNLECYIGHQRVMAQSSPYYAGWITTELVGPFKGEPGTENW